ncbi:hypothetical protein FRB97_009726 [Tulasnella sp. 331]|nr:hypothetical protein FRB97_009726 [Tulasnella sp. 331]
MTDAASLEQIVESHEGKHLKLIIWSSKLRTSRVVPVLPSRQWALSPPPPLLAPLPPTPSSIDGKPSLLGLSMRLCQPEFALDHVWHILEILEGSPAESAGLVPFGDWVVGWSGGVLSKEGDFYDVIEQHVEKPLRVYVYSYDFDTLREVVLVPNRMWGGAGLLGCGVGYGLLHRIPAIQSGSDEVDLTAGNEMDDADDEEGGGSHGHGYEHGGQDGLFVPADEYPEFDASAALNGRMYGNGGRLHGVEELDEEEDDEDDDDDLDHDRGHSGHNGHSHSHAHEEEEEDAGHDHHHHHHHDHSGHSHSHDHDHDHSPHDHHQHQSHDHETHDHNDSHDHDDDHDDDHDEWDSWQQDQDQSQHKKVRSGAPSPSPSPCLAPSVIVNSSVHTISAPAPQKVPPPISNLDLSSPISPPPSSSRPFSGSPGEAALAEYRRRSLTPDSIKRSMSPSTTSQRVDDVMGIRSLRMGAGSPRLAAFAGLGAGASGLGDRRSSWNIPQSQNSPSTPKAESMLSKSYAPPVGSEAEDGSEGDATTLDGSLTSVD